MSSSVDVFTGSRISNKNAVSSGVAVSTDDDGNKRLQPSLMNEGLGSVLSSLFFIVLGCLFLFAAGKADG
jgi:hypothetical protein